MNRKIGLWQFAGFAMTSIVGTILHFLHEWTDSGIVALFSGVNESTWEHMKILFFPMFVFAVLEYFFIGREYEGFWCIKLRGIILGLLLIPGLYYGLSGALGSTPDYVNIGIFFVSAAIVYIYETKQFKCDCNKLRKEVPAVILICVIAVLFFVFTFKPLQIPLFIDPVSGTYGI